MRISRLRWVLLAAIGASQAAFARPVNLIFILTDDQGAWSVGAYGNPEAKTPAIDRLAREGMRFRRAFATIPVCSPSRATFLTGRIPSQHGIHDWIQFENMGARARYILDREVLLSQILAQQGYVCGLSGKWHMGDSLHPHAGFSDWFTLPEGSSVYNNAPMCRDGQVAPVSGYITDRITDHALEFVQTNKDRPFFLYVAYSAPHSPWTGHPQDLVDEYMKIPFASIPNDPPHPWSITPASRYGHKETLAQYFAAVSAVDRNVDRMMKRVEELGLTKDTLVVYASDQGFNVGHHGLWGKGNASNPRNMFDTSMQIPLIFHQPGTVPAASETDALFSSYDFVPTVLDYLKLPPATGRNLCGQSLAAVLRGETKKGPADAVFGEYGRTRMIRTDRWKLIHRADGGPDELYDLQADPDEKKNLVDQPDLRKTRIELRTRLFQWFDRFAESGADPIGREYLRPADQ